MGRPRLPWKRGPVAWKVVRQAEEVRERLKLFPKPSASLRTAARLLGVSMQPVRDWVRLGYLNRAGPRRRILKSEMERFLEWLVCRAEPFSFEHHPNRFTRDGKGPPARFHTLGEARFSWPKGCKSLTPTELAALIGCHPSLIIKAIHYCYSIYRLGHHKTPCRWIITKRAWRARFPASIAGPPRLPPLSGPELLSTNEVAQHLRLCGCRALTNYHVRRYIKAGLLLAIRPTAEHRKLFVTLQSVKIFRKKLLTGSLRSIFRSDMQWGCKTAARGLRKNARKHTSP